MQEHEKWVIAERDELSDKIEKLEQFVGGPIYCALAEADRTLLDVQLGAMAQLEFILNHRIKRFSK